MFSLDLWLQVLAVLTAFAAAGWLVSLVKKDVSIVDSMWSIMFLLAAVVYVDFESLSDRAVLLLALVALWSIRLSVYITWRNWDEGEDFRYQEIRQRNEPNFAFKSLYIVFVLQAALAWLISLPLMAAASTAAPLGWLDAAGVALFVLGFFFEALGDYQLSRFKSDPENQDKVLNTGLWALTRHPNYFGDFCIWWGFFLMAAATGGWWSVIGPVLMSILLLKVSGVALLERDITERRPKYADYIRQTNAFFPGLKKVRS